MQCLLQQAAVEQKEDNDLASLTMMTTQQPDWQDKSWNLAFLQTKRYTVYYTH